MATETQSSAQPAGHLEATPQDVMAYRERASSDQQIRFVATTSAPLDGSRLSKAVRLMVDAEPILGCRFVQDPQQPYWARRDDLDRLHLSRVLDTPEQDADMWKFIEEPLDRLHAPLIQVRVFRSALSRRDRLCVKIDGEAVDAPGAKECLKLLSATYRNLAVNPEYRAEVRAGVRYPERISGQYASQTPDPAPSGPPNWSFGGRSNNIAGRAFAVRRMGPARYEAIAAYCREHDATIDDVLLAAFFRGIVTLLDPPRHVMLPVQVPVDLRPYLPAGPAQQIRNLSTTVRPAIPREATATLETALAAVKEATKRLLANLPAVESADPRSTTDPAIANFGSIEDTLVDFGDVEVLDAYMLGPIVYPPGLLIGVSDYEGTMTLSAGYSSTAIEGSIVQMAVDSVVDEMPGRE